MSWPALAGDVNDGDRLEVPEITNVPADVNKNGDPDMLTSSYVIGFSKSKLL